MVQQEGRQDKGYADSHDAKRFYDTLKTGYGPQSSGSSPLLTEEGTHLLTEKKQILERWADHFNQVLNRPAEINDKAITSLPQVETNRNLDNLPTEDEVRKAVKQLSCGKAPGPDTLPTKIYKAGGSALIQKLTELFETMWSEEQVPQQLNDATLVHVYKRKVTASPATTTEVNLSCPLLGRSSDVFYSTASFSILSRVSSQKVSVAFVQDAEQ